MINDILKRIQQLTIAILLICLSSFYYSLSAQTSWTRTNGPGGGEIMDIASDGTNLFAGGPSGVWHSVNNGDTWVPYNNFSGGNFFSPGIFSLATDSVNIYAGTVNGQVFTSNINNGIWSMATVSPGNINALEFVSGKLYAGTSAGMFMSVDSGVNWLNFNNGMTPSSILCLASDGNYLYAGGLDEALYRLTIGDSIWLPVNSGFANDHILSLLIDGNYVYAGTGFDLIKRTSDNGLSWVDVASGLPVTNYGVKELSKFDGFIYANLMPFGMYKSNDNGNSWQSTAFGYSQYPRVLEAHNSFLFSGSLDKGVQRKETGSSLWTLQLNGMNNAYVNSLTVQDQRLLAATRSGIYRTDDGGNVWTGPAIPGSDFDMISIVANDSLVFAGSNDDGIFRSANGGISWSTVNNGVPACNWNGTIPLYCRITDLHLLDNYVFASAEYVGVLRSTDMGNSWDTISNGLVTTSDKRVMAIASIGSNLYISSLSGNIFVSSDYGLTWTLSNNTFSGPTASLTTIGTHIFATTNTFSGVGSVFSYHEGDTSWLPVNLGAWSNNAPIKFITHAGHYLFVDVGGEMIFSDDLGLTWNSVGNSLECNFVKSMVIIGTDVFATAGARGVFKNNSLLTEMNEHLSSDKCTIYPNPLSNSEQIVTLDCEELEGVKDIELYDLRGVLIRKLNPNYKNQINLNQVSPGFYLLRIISMDKVSSFKIIVK